MEIWTYLSCSPNSKDVRIAGVEWRGGWVGENEFGVATGSGLHKTPQATKNNWCFILTLKRSLWLYEKNNINWTKSVCEENFYGIFQKSVGT